MSDLTKLTAEFEATLLDRNELLAHYQRVTAENLRLTKRLEQCEAALKQITHIPTMPFPDRQAHSERAFTNAVWNAWCKIQDAARAAVEGK